MVGKESPAAALAAAHRLASRSDPTSCVIDLLLEPNPFFPLASHICWRWMYNSAEDRIWDTGVQVSELLTRPILVRATEAATEFSSLRASAEEAQRVFESKEASCKLRV